ncbi:transposase, partial [Nonomuraea guangzhouensis]
MLIVADAGYDITRLAYVLRDLPVELLGRIRSDRVLRLPAPPRLPGTNGRPPKHGGEFALADPATWPAAAVSTLTDTTHYGTAATSAWDRLHPRLTHRAAWLDHEGEPPIIEGTLIRLKVEHLPGDRDAPPVWLWSSKTGATSTDVDRCWQAFLRRFDLEHTYRFWKQTLGWTRPKLRAAQAADRWTWLLLIAHTQLRLGRRLTEDLRHPWEKAVPAGSAHSRPGPARVSKPASRTRPASGRTQTLQARPRTPTRHPQPPTRHPLRRRQNRQTRPHPRSTTTIRRIKNKLSARVQTDRQFDWGDA